MSMNRRSWLRRNWRWLGLAVLLLLVLAVPEAAARAGGGGSFRSGGGSSGGSGGSGGGGGGGMAIYFLVRLIIAHPVVGVPIAIVVVTVLAFGAYKGKQEADVQIQGRGIRRGRSMADKASLERGIAQIVAEDVCFSEDAFLRRTSKAFLQLQNAWCDQNLGPVRHFISDAVHERFTLQLAEMEQMGLRNMMEDVSVVGNKIAQVDVSPQFQTITVRVQATAVDYTMDGGGKRISGSKTPQAFAEYWSFIRRPGAQTKDSDGLLEGSCPNCGTGLQLNQAANCESCGAKVQSGQYDWVLAEITQESEWKPAQHHEVPGFAAMSAADRSFSLQHLEDRTSVMFWRRIAALQSGKVDPLRKMAREECCEKLALELRPDGSGARLIPTDAAVGAVDTVGIFCEAPVDRALLEIRWSCGQQQLLADGTARPHAATSFRSFYFLLSRDHGVTGDADQALSSAHCPGCGAPAMASAASACDYCGEVLNQGDRDWVLDGIYPRHAPLVTELLERAQQLGTSQPGEDAPAGLGAATPSGGTELAAWMVYMMLADGEIDDKEEKLLRTFATNHGVSDAQTQQLIASMKAGELEVGLPADGQEARRWLETIAEMALADGFIAKEEQQAMLALGEHLELAQHDVMQIIAKTRKRMYQEEKERMRELRRRM